MSEKEVREGIAAYCARVALNQREAENIVAGKIKDLRAGKKPEDYDREDADRFLNLCRARAAHSRGMMIAEHIGAFALSGAEDEFNAIPT
jgi:hypothetical protein